MKNYIKINHEENCYYINERIYNDLITKESMDNPIAKRHNLLLCCDLAINRRTNVLLKTRSHLESIFDNYFNII